MPVPKPVDVADHEFADEVLNADEMTEVVRARWPRRAKHNVAAFDAGLRVRGTS